MKYRMNKKCKVKVIHDQLNLLLWSLQLTNQLIWRCLKNKKKSFYTLMNSSLWFYIFYFISIHFLLAKKLKKKKIKLWTKNRILSHIDSDVCCERHLLQFYSIQWPHQFAITLYRAELITCKTKFCSHLWFHSPWVDSNVSKSSPSSSPFDECEIRLFLTWSFSFV